MNIRETLCAINTLPYVSARFERHTGEYRVTLRYVNERDGWSAAQYRERAEAVAYYTDDAADAVSTAVHMNLAYGKSIAA